MARLTNLYGVTESLPAIPKLHSIQRTFTKPCKIKCISKDEFHCIEECSSLPLNNATRRSVIGLVSIALCAQSGVKTSLAQDDNNGLWLSDPLPGLPPAYNKIANEETGTRSFLYRGVYVSNLGTTVGAYRYRIKKSAFDLMAMGDLIGQDAWNYIRRYLQLKGTVMYYDFDKLISATPASDQKPLTDLANRLFDNFEKFQDAVKVKDLPLTESCYRDTTVILQEVMDRMA